MHLVFQVYSFLVHMFLCVLVYKHVHSVCISVRRDRKRTSDPRELELEVLVNYHVGTGN